jgi:Uma2 family endonuclease
MHPKLTITTPPLESGDRLTRAEFERRYQAMPASVKADLVEGVVYVASPVRIYHGTPHAAILTWLGTYWAATPGIQLADNSTVRLDLDNEPQPDALLRIESETIGTSRISEDGYVEGAPELVVEIAVSSASLDLGAKLQVYRRNGVKEYLVWQVFDDRFDWFVLSDGEYQLLQLNAAGLLCSQIFPGLWLDAQALLAGNLAQVLSRLQPGLQTSEHQALVDRLASL